MKTFIALLLLATSLYAQVPLAPSGLCVDDNCVTTPVVQGIKWHPGHYLQNRLRETTTKLAVSSFYTQSLPANLKGYVQPVGWAVVEPTAGIYNWSRIDWALAQAKSQHRQLIVRFWTRSCCTAGADVTGWIPADLVPTAIDYRYGRMSRMWESATVDRYIAMLRAFAARYDGEGALEAVVSDETAQGVYQPPSGYSSAMLSSQYQRIQNAWRKAAPHTQLFLFANYLSPPEPNLTALYVNAVATGTGVGGPDLAPPRSIDGYKVVQGLIGGHDYRDELAQLYNFEYLPYLAGQSAQQAYDFAVNTLHANYLAWQMRTDGTEGQNWTTGVVPVINAHPDLRTLCPRSYPGCDH